MRSVSLLLLGSLLLLAFAPVAAAAPATTCGGPVLQYASCMAAQAEKTVGTATCAVLDAAVLATIRLYEQVVGPWDPSILNYRCDP
jgi:hypothetical protein